MRVASLNLVLSMLLATVTSAQKTAELDAEG